MLDNSDERQFNETMLDNLVYETLDGKVNMKVIKCELCKFSSHNLEAVDSNKGINKDILQARNSNSHGSAICLK